MSAMRCGSVCVLLLLWLAAAAAAQSEAPARDPAPEPIGGRLEIAAVVSGTSASALGTATAELTPNTGLTSFKLFDSSATLAATVTADLRVGWRLSRAVTLSVAGGLSRPSLRVLIANDPELTGGVGFSGERLLQWTIGGRADWEIHRLSFASGRAVPFVTAGASYLRQRHEGGGGAGGQVYQGGGGLACAWRVRPASRLQRVSLIVEMKAIHTKGGYHWGREARTSFAAGAGLSTTWGRARKSRIMEPSSSGRS